MELPHHLFPVDRILVRQVCGVHEYVRTYIHVANEGNIEPILALLNKLPAVTRILLFVLLDPVMMRIGCVFSALSSSQSTPHPVFPRVAPFPFIPFLVKCQIREHLAFRIPHPFHEFSTEDVRLLAENVEARCFELEIGGADLFVMEQRPSD
jgi:hypothetical protein